MTQQLRSLTSEVFSKQFLGGSGWSFVDMFMCMTATHNFLLKTDSFSNFLIKF